MSDLTDDRRGAYEPVTKYGLPCRPHVKNTTTLHQKAQWGADVRPEPPPDTEPILPKRLVRPATGPLNPRTETKAHKVKYLFHLAGQFPAYDLLGHEYAKASR
jgi:hypothetical protein